MQILELLITSALVVLIWIIQILHYPSFLFVDHEKFAAFEAFHTSRISLIVIPLMLTEVGVALANPRPVIIGIIVLIWLSTFFLQVPCHDILRSGFDEKTVQRLISTNWIRTVLWSIKLGLLVGAYKWKIG
jgi:hypothetical protein